MNKNITWKQSLLIAILCYALKFLLGGILPNVLIAILEIVGLIALILGIFGAVKAAFSKKKHNS